MENKSEIITDYLAGRLAKDEEEKLFDSIAMDADYREEFRQTLAIDRALRATANSFAPPAGLTNSIFGEIAKLTASAPVPTPPAAGFNWMAGLTSAIVGSIITVAAIFSIYYFGLKSADSETKSREKSIIAPTPSQPTNTFETQKPLRSSTGQKGVESDLKRNYSARSNELVAANSPLKRDPAPNETSADIESDYVTPNAIVFAKRTPAIDKSRAVLVKVTELERSSNSQAFELIEFNPFDISSEIGNYLFSVELRGSVSKNLPEQTINPEKFSPLNNFAAALYWLPSDKFAIGIEARGETFFLRYTGKDAIGRLIEYDQTPNITTLGLTGRYRPIRIGDLAPFIQLSLGYSYYGSSVRPGLGAEFEITPRFGINASGEWAAFFYRHQSKSFQANKLNLNCGIYFKF